MAEQFYTILTSIGKAKIANSIPLGTKVNLTKLRIGDGGGAYYNPTEDQIDVKGFVYECSVGAVKTDEENPNWIVIETTIPGSVGGFMVREAGVFDEEGNLIAIGKYPETYKPVTADGSSKDLLIRMILEVSNAESVTLKINPTVILATMKDIQILESKMNALSDKLNLHLADNKEHIPYLIATGAANTYTVALDPVPTVYQDGMALCVKINIASTSASTLNVNSLGAKPILDSLGNPITNGGLKAGLPYTMRYNGINFIVQGKGGGGDATAAQLLLGKKATVDSGQIVGTLDLTNLVTANIKSGVTINGVTGKTSVVETADATAIAADILSGKITYVNGVKVTGSIPSKLAATITPGTTDQTIAASQYLSGIQTILGDPDLISANIKAGVNIFNVQGKASVVDTVDATALLSSQIVAGYNAYVNGNKINGSATIQSLGGKRFASGVVNNYFIGNGGSVITLNLQFTPSVMLFKYLNPNGIRYTYAYWYPYNIANGIAGIAPTTLPTNAAVYIMVNGGTVTACFDPSMPQTCTVQVDWVAFE